MVLDFTMSKTTWNELFEKLLNAIVDFFARFDIKIFADEEETTEA